MKLPKHLITELIAADLGERNVRPLYNGWLIWRNGKCSFCSVAEVEEELKKRRPGE
jgi:hypothetical protein